MSRVVRLHQDTLDRLLALRQGDESVQDVLTRLVPAPPIAVDRYTGLRNAVRAHLAMLEAHGFLPHLPHGAFDRLKNALEAAPTFTDPHAPCCRFHATGGERTASCGGDDARLPGWDTATVVCAHCDGAGCAECQETGEVVAPC